MSLGSEALGFRGVSCPDIDLTGELWWASHPPPPHPPHPTPPPPPPLPQVKEAVCWVPYKRTLGPDVLFNPRPKLHNPSKQVRDHLQGPCNYLRSIPWLALNPKP